MSKYVISRPAIRDLESISSYFANVNVEAGEKFLQGFNKLCKQQL
jgi:toxin ParE1/3/4